MHVKLPRCNTAKMSLENDIFQCAFAKKKQKQRVWCHKLNHFIALDACRKNVELCYIRSEHCSSRIIPAHMISVLLNMLYKIQENFQTCLLLNIYETRCARNAMFSSSSSLNSLTRKCLQKTYESISTSSSPVLNSREDQSLQH